MVFRGINYFQPRGNIQLIQVMRSKQKRLPNGQGLEVLGFCTELPQEAFAADELLKTSISDLLKLNVIQFLVNDKS